MEHSPTIAELAKALSKAQGEMENVVKSTENPFFKSMYADLGSVLDAIRKPLSDNGLSVIQAPETIDGKVAVTTMLAHVSGEWVKASLLITPKDLSNPQTYGSIVTYFRRYMVSGMAGVASEDDDGNTGSKSEEKKEEKKPEKPPDKPAPTGKISAGQTKYVQMLFGKVGYKEDLDKYAYATGVIDRPIVSISDLTTKEAHLVIEALTKLLGTPEAS